MPCITSNKLSAFVIQAIFYCVLIVRATQLITDVPFRTCSHIWWSNNSSCLVIAMALLFFPILTYIAASIGKDEQCNLVLSSAAPGNEQSSSLAIFRVPLEISQLWIALSWLSTAIQSSKGWAALVLEGGWKPIVWCSASYANPTTLQRWIHFFLDDMVYRRWCSDTILCTYAHKRVVSRSEGNQIQFFLALHTIPT